MSGPAAWVVSTGVCTPLGLSSLQVAMCTRARKMEPTTTYFRNRRGGAISVCRLGTLPGTLHGYYRMGHIASFAIQEALAGGGPDPIPLVIALPEAGRADDDTRLSHGFVADLAAACRLPIDVGRSKTVRCGRAGFAVAVDAALTMMKQPAGPELALVGGVDSYYHPAVLRGLDDALRLHGEGTEHGFVPSEGAAFVLLRRPEAKRAPGPLLGIGRVVLGLEDDDPNTGRAMTTILHTLREDGPMPWVLTDLNGEPERTREWTMAEIRALGRDEGVQHDRLVSELGDMGAATGAVLATIACSFFGAGCAPAEDAVIALASDGEERAAFRVQEVP